jgi:hypothetical protein
MLPAHVTHVRKYWRSHWAHDNSSCAHHFPRRIAPAFLDRVGVAGQLMQTFQSGIESSRWNLKNKLLRIRQAARTEIEPFCFSWHLNAMASGKTKYFFNFLKNKKAVNIFWFS